MRYIRTIAILISVLNLTNLKSQTPCPKNMDLNKYVEAVIESDVNSTNVIFIMKMRDSNNIMKRYLISSREFAEFIHVYYFLDTSLRTTIKKAILGEDIGYKFDYKINNYLVPEPLYKKFEKKSAPSVYKKYFDKEGIQKGNPIIFYNWGDYSGILSYLIDHYAIIRLQDFLGLVVSSKPCRCKSAKPK